MTTETHQDQVFAELPWVAGIDSLCDYDWLGSNPDGRVLRKAIHDLDGNEEAVAFLAKPLRNLIKIMLEWPVQLNPLTDLNLFTSFYWMECAGNREQADEMINAIEKLFQRHYPGAPRTIDDFLLRLRAHAESCLSSDEAQRRRPRSHANL